MNKKIACFLFVKNILFGAAQKHTPILVQNLLEEPIKVDVRQLNPSNYLVDSLHFDIPGHSSKKMIAAFTDLQNIISVKIPVNGSLNGYNFDGTPQEKSYIKVYRDKECTIQVILEHWLNLHKRPSTISRME